MPNEISVFSRRRFLATGIGLATTMQLQRAAHALGLSPGAEVCKLTPEQEVGPFYVADELLRSNLVEGKAGVPLALRIMVLDARSCKPLRNAAIDLWHCDALGLYSGFVKQADSGGMGPGGPGGPGGPRPGFDPQHHGPPPQGMGPHENHPTDKFTFLRGIQITGADGAVNFTTIFPGFYMGRTNHVHFKVRLDGHAAGKSYAAGHTSHAGQVFFPEDVAVELMQHPPYNSHKIHRTTQSEDFVFGGQDGRLSMANLQPLYPQRTSAGFRAELVVSVDPTATPAAVGVGPGGPPAPRS